MLTRSCCRWRHMAMGKSMPQCEAMWTAALEDPSVEAIQRRGQWLVPYFEGVRKEKGDVQEHVQSTGRSAQITTPAQLAQLQAQGEILLQQFSKNSSAIWLIVHGLHPMYPSLQQHEDA